MSKVSYFEFKPGRWVKLVDGEVVGPATPEEAAAWQREKMEQVRIWQDVLQQATVPEPQPARPRRVPTPAQEPAEAKRPSPGAKPRPVKPPISVKADKLPAEEPVKSLADGEVAARAAKPRPQPATKAAPVDKAAKTKTKPTVKAAPAKRAPSAKPKLIAEAVPAEKVTMAKPTPAATAVSLKTKPKPEVAPQAAPAKRAVKADLKETTEIVSPKKVAKPIIQTAPLEQEVMQTQPEPTVKPSITAAPRRPAAKTAPSAPRDRSNQLYLWIMASPTDDLITTVRSGLKRYEERFSQPAEVVLCHTEDVATLEKADLPVDVRQAKGVPPRSFWIGLK